MGVDLIVSEDDGVVYLIDLNYFPSYTNTFKEVDNLSDLIIQQLKKHYDEWNGN